MRGGPSPVLALLLDALARRRIALGAVSFGVLALAAVTLARMPLQLLPEVRYPQVRVIGDLPGQTSRVIEESINLPLEAALAGTPGLVRLESRSGDGRAYVELFFQPGYDLDRAFADTTQAAQRARAQIPPEFPEPRIFAVSTMQEPALQFAFGSPGLAVEELRQRLRAQLVPRLRAVPGVEAIFIGREEVPELVVEVDPGRQRALGVDLEAIEALLLEATEPPTGGALRNAWFEGIGILGDEGWDATRLERRLVPLGEAGGTVPLGSLARVHRAPSEERLQTRLDGNDAVLLTVHRSPHAHSLRTASRVRAIVRETGAGPAFAGVESTLLFDDSVVTQSAVRSVLVAAVGGALLAMTLLLVGLRQRRYMPLVALVVAVSLGAALVVLHLLGATLNLLTMTGLLLSVGLGLDYSIIYFDRLERLPRGTDRPHVAAMVQMAGPLLGALLTTLAAVLPFLLVEGMVALLFRPLIWTVVVTALSSFGFALVLLPTFARGGQARARAPQDPPAPSWLWRLVQRPAVVWGLAALLGGALLLGGRTLPFEVLPVVDDGFVSLRITHPAGIPAANLDELTRRVEGALSELEGTASLFTTVGGYFREGLPSSRPGTSNFMVRVDTRGGRLPSRAWAAAAREAVAALDIPALSLSVTLPRIRGVQTRLSEADLIVVLTREDGDLLALGEVEGDVVRALRGVPGLTDVERVRSGASSRWRLEPRQDALALYGIPTSTLRRTLDYGLEGRVLRQRVDRGEPLALRVRYDRRVAGGPDQLGSLPVAGADGAQVHLGELVEASLVEEPTHIERRENRRVIRVTAQLDPAGPGPGRVAREVEQALGAAGLPEGVSWWLEGEIEALEETRRTFGVALVMALMMVLTLLVIQYGSLAFAAAALVSIPLCGVGALAILGLMERPIDAMVLAGLLIAVGIVANNVILVLSQARALCEEHDSVSLAEALRRAARDRFRPILLTVLSTVLGMSPLLWGGAQVFGLLQPLAVALTGALLISIPLACVVLPGLVTSLSRGSKRAVPRSAG